MVANNICIMSTFDWLSINKKICVQKCFLYIRKELVNFKHMWNIYPDFDNHQHHFGIARVGCCHVHFKVELVFGNFNPALRYKSTHDGV